MLVNRRRFLERASAMGALAVSHSQLFARAATSSNDVHTMPFGNGELLSLNDGHLSLPLSFVLPDTIDPEERASFLSDNDLGPKMLTPPCNVTLWRSPEPDGRLVLFDVGAGANFMPGAGLLAESLVEAGIDPLDITDVVLTHAHPDHLWGALDDFDELTFPEAIYHVHRGERDYWLAEDTLAKTPDSRKSFVVGAQNRLPLLDQRLALFEWGDEILPGIEAMDTHGHTPGHTSFALHAGSNTLYVLGDALTHSVISFERPSWPSGSDQDPGQGMSTRLALLDRLAREQSLVLGYHLSAPGTGRVERATGAYRFVTDE